MTKAVRAQRTRVRNPAPRAKPQPHARKTILVAVLDGARAAIYTAVPAAAGRSGLRLVSVPGGRLRQSNRKSRAIVSDRPGHKSTGAGRGRYALGPKSDPHDRAERQFVIDVAAALERAVAAQKYDELVLIAPPRAMGDLRAHLSPALARRDILEITKEWTELNPAEIAKRLTALLMPGA